MWLQYENVLHETYYQKCNCFASSNTISIKICLRKIDVAMIYLLMFVLIFFLSFKENNKIRSNFPMCFWYDSLFLKTCSFFFVLAWYVVNCEKWVVIDPFQEIRPKKILFLGGWECGCVRTRYLKDQFSFIRFVIYCMSMEWEICHSHSTLYMAILHVQNASEDIFASYH